MDRVLGSRRRTAPAIVAGVVACVTLVATLDVRRVRAETALEPTAAHDIIERKQRLELRLALALAEQFSHPELLGPLRQLAAAALTEIASIGTSTSSTLAGAVDKAIANESFILTLRVGGPWQGGIKDTAGMARILPYVGRLTVEQCADIIRLYGSVVDSAAAVDLEYRKLAAEKTAFRAGIISTVEAQKQVWDERDRGQPFGRRRTRIDPRLSSTAAYQRLRSKMYASDFQEELIALEGGIKTTILDDDSTVGKLERYYGLAYGADISGTTSDALWVFERFWGKGYDPIYMLLPVATIVGQGHHTLIEVALALSVTHRITYRIGEYTTLMPVTNHPAAASMRQILTEFEAMPDNRPLGCWYPTPTELGGCYEFTPDQFNHLKNNALRVLDQLARRPTFPTHLDIDAFFLDRTPPPPAPKPAPIPTPAPEAIPTPIPMPTPAPSPMPAPSSPDTGPVPNAEPSPNTAPSPTAAE
jgi:hypothetical protein